MVSMGKFAVFAVVVLALSGCGAAVASAPGDGARASAPALTAAPTTPAQEEFVTATHRIVGLEDVPAPEALIVGEDVCARLDAGEDPTTMAPVANGTEATNKEMVIVAALTLCKEHDAPVQEAFAAPIREAEAARIAEEIAHPTEIQTSPPD